MLCPFNILIQGDKKVPAPPKRDISTQIQKKQVSNKPMTMFLKKLFARNDLILPFRCVGTTSIYNVICKAGGYPPLAVC